MPAIRFMDVPYAADGIHGVLDSFIEKEHLGWLDENKISIPDLSREPPLRSHARGLMTRYQMDKLDGINVRIILQKNPTFYSSEYMQKEAITIYEGGAILNTNALDDKRTTGNDEGQTKTEDGVSAKSMKTFRKRVNRIFRRLLCLPMKED